MKTKFITQKTTLGFNWIELNDLINSLKLKIKDCIELDKMLGVKFPYYITDKNILKLYKRILKSYKNYQ